MYETLRDMGITDIEHIEKYTIRQEGDEDIIKIYFKRRKGELFAHSIKFRHGRSKKMVLVDGGKRIYKEVSEVSPTILKAERELNRIVQREMTTRDFKQRILNDIEHLEKVMARKLAQLKADVESLDSD